MFFVSFPYSSMQVLGWYLKTGHDHLSHPSQLTIHNRDAVQPMWFI